MATQTVFNYFPIKQDLLLDRNEKIIATVVRLIRERPTGTSPAAAIRPAAHAEIDQLRDLTIDQARGGLGALTAASPTIRRLVLETVDRQADAIAEALSVTDPGLTPEVAKVRGIALAWTFQTIIDHTGKRYRDGAAPACIADELDPLVDALLDDLDRRQ